MIARRTTPRTPRATPRATRGSASVEAALTIALVMIPLTLGMIDYGEAISETARLDRAYQAAIYNIWANPGSYTASTIQSAAQAAYGSTSPSLSISTTTACYCVTSGYIKGSAVSCTATCSGGQILAAYQTVAASTRFALPAAFPGVTSPMPLTVAGTVRVK